MQTPIVVDFPLRGEWFAPNTPGTKVPSHGTDILGQFLRAAQLGVTKINIDTDGRLVWTRVHREHFNEHPENFDLRPVGKVFMAEYAKFIADKNVKLGSAGQLEAVRKLLNK